MKICIWHVYIHKLGNISILDFFKLFISLKGSTTLINRIQINCFYMTADFVLCSLNNIFFKIAFIW